MDQLGALATDGVLPPWSSWFDEDAMRALVPDVRLRADLEDEMPRLPLSHFDASVPLPHGWDELPCAYLLLASEPYGESAADARDRGWPVAEIPGAQHLALVTDPIAVRPSTSNTRSWDRPRGTSLLFVARGGTAELCGACGAVRPKSDQRRETGAGACACKRGHDVAARDCSGRRARAQGEAPASQQRSCLGALVPPSARCWDGRI